MKTSHEYKKRKEENKRHDAYRRQLIEFNTKPICREPVARNKYLARNTPPKTIQLTIYEHPTGYMVLCDAKDSEEWI